MTNLKSPISNNKSPLRSRPRGIVLALLSVLALAATLIAAPPAGPTAAPASQPGLFPYNGDFELLGPKLHPEDAPWPKHFAVKDGADWPDGWATKHPQNVKCIDVGGVHRHVIEMTGDEGLMGTYGTDVLSRPIPCKPNTLYRVTGWTRSEGPNFIIFVKGYATVTRKVDGQPQTFDDEVYMMRKEVGPSRDWRQFTLEFSIKPTVEFSQFQHQIKYLRILLWAYWPKGTCWYDDVRFQELGPAPGAATQPKEAVTHVGTKPRLGPGADSGAGSGAGSGGAEDGPTTQGAPGNVPGEFDEEQTFLDAANAFNGGEDAAALKLVNELLRRVPDQPNYHLLGARISAHAGRLAEANAHAQWLLKNPKSEPWQLDWARVVAAEVCWHAGDKDKARGLLRQVLAAPESENAKSAAEALRKQIEQGPATQP